MEDNAQPLRWQGDTFSTIMGPIQQNRILQLSTHTELIGRPKVTEVACYLGPQFTAMPDNALYILGENWL